MHLRENIIATKKGAPSSEVMAPTGRAEPFPMLLDIVSANKSKRLPVSADTGME